MLVVLSKNDEVVPNAMGQSLYEASLASTVPSVQERGPEGLPILIIVDGALHENAWEHRIWRSVMSEYISRSSQLSHESNSRGLGKDPSIADGSRDMI